MASAGSPVDRLPPPFPVEAESKPELPKKESPVPLENDFKTNGIQDEQEDADLFADATVELSLDNTQNHIKKESTTVFSPVPSLEGTTHSSSKQQSKTYEELEEEEQEDQFELSVGVSDPEKIGELPCNGRHLTEWCERFFMRVNGTSVLPFCRYIQRTVSHPTMLQDPDVREFLEKDELPRAVGTQTLSGAGLLKMFNRATDAVSKMTIKMNESDIWFEEKLQEVEGEEQRLRKLHAIVEMLANHRKELSLNTSQFAKSLAMLGSSEDNTALSRALSQLAEVEEKIEQLHQEQANSDFFLLAELLSDYIRLLASVRGAFDQRMKAWQRWQDAQVTLQKKRETEARLLWANKPDKLQQAKEEISEWESRMTQYEREFERLSATLRKEVLRFEKEKTKDFRTHVTKYLETLLQSQQQLVKYWEAFLPEAKAIS
ncbi:sorting nexin-1 [Pseudonaja textilis]|nr:sorting nexin-1 [Pseudonaja textilis]